MASIVSALIEKIEKQHAAIIAAAAAKNDALLRFVLKDANTLPPRADLPLSVRSFLEQVYVDMKEKETKWMAMFVRKLRAGRNLFI